MIATLTRFNSAPLSSQTTPSRPPRLRGEPEKEKIEQQSNQSPEPICVICEICGSVAPVLAQPVCVAQRTETRLHVLRRVRVRSIVAAGRGAPDIDSLKCGLAPYGTGVPCVSTSREAGPSIRDLGSVPIHASDVA